MRISDWSSDVCSSDLWTVGAAKTKATMVAGDKMSTDVIDRAVALAKKMQGGEGKAVRMTPVDVDGGKHFIGLFGTEQMYDIRREVGDRKSTRLNSSH